MFELQPVQVVTALSGLVLALLGLVLLKVPRKGGDVWAFALFTLLWGAQIMSAAVTRMGTDSVVVTVGAFLLVGFMALAYWPLLHFAMVHVRPVPRFSVSPFMPVLLAVPALLVLLLVLSEPSRFFNVVADDAGGVTWDPGPWFIPLVAGPFLAGFFLAFGLLYWKSEVEPEWPNRRRLLLVSAALLLWVGYTSVRGSVGGTIAVLAGGQISFVFAISIAGFLLTGAVVVRTVLKGFADTSARLGGLPASVVVLAAALVPGLTGAVEILLAQQGMQFETVGLWRLLMVGLVVYGVARAKLFDVEVQMVRFAPVTGYLVAAGVAVGFVWFFLSAALVENPVLGVAATMGALLVTIPAGRATKGIVRMVAPGVHEPDYLYKRKLEVYQAALNEVVSKGAQDETQDQMLTDIRRALGITAREHQLMMYFLGSSPSPSQTLQETGQTGRFRIEKELGRGSSGRAVLAHDEVLHRTVVLKQPLAIWMHDEKERENFLREARVMARINHPNVVTVYEIRSEQEPPDLVLEYVDGGNLKDLIALKGCLSPDRAVKVADDVLCALERVHAEGIIHRDLKPANVLLDGDGTAKVTDFGVARISQSVPVEVTMAAPDVQPGTLAYMSPEQARGDEVDARSDLYSVGVVLYEMLTGRLPYDLKGRRSAEAKAAIQTHPPRIPAEGLPGPFEGFLARALEKYPEKRFQDARAMREALSDTVGSGEGGRGAPKSTPE